MPYCSCWWFGSLVSVVPVIFIQARQEIVYFGQYAVQIRPPDMFLQPDQLRQMGCLMPRREYKGQRRLPTRAFPPLGRQHLPKFFPLQRLRAHASITLCFLENMIQGWNRSSGFFFPCFL